MDAPIILGNSEGIIKLLLAVLAIILAISAYLDRRYGHLFEKSKARFLDMFPPDRSDTDTVSPHRTETPREVHDMLRRRAEIIMNLKPRSLRNVMIGIAASLVYVSLLYVLGIFSGHLDGFFNVDALLIRAVKIGIILVFLVSIALAHGIGGASAQRRNLQRQLIGFHHIHSAVERARGNW